MTTSLGLQKRLRQVAGRGFRWRVGSAAELVVVDGQQIVLVEPPGDDGADRGRWVEFGQGNGFGYFAAIWGRTTIPPLPSS
jgi:hypothetical protein